MAIPLEFTMTIDRPVDEVFEYLTSPENDGEWKGEVIEANPVDGGEMELGATWTQILDGPIGTPEIAFECTGYDPPNRFSFQMTSGFFGDRVRTRDAEYTLTPAGDSTRLTFTGKSQASGVMRLLEPLVAPMVRKDIGTAFEELKAALESDENSEL